MSFLDNFESICRSKGLAPTRALVMSGLSNSLYAKWRKSPEAVPNLDTLKALANTLHVSVDTLAYGDRGLYTVDLVNYPELKELLYFCTDLPAEKRRQILDYARFLAAGRGNPE